MSRVWVPKVLCYKVGGGGGIGGEREVDEGGYGGSGSARERRE